MGEMKYFCISTCKLNTLQLDSQCKAECKAGLWKKLCEERIDVVIDEEDGLMLKEGIWNAKVKRWTGDMDFKN